MNIRSLVKHGITYIDFGPSDLMFDIEAHDHPFLKSVENCREFVLKELEGAKNRKARFRTVISLRLDGEELFFEGIVEGSIRTEKTGSKGFGYDPIFQPDGFSLTFAEMDLAEKNEISHRGRATQKLVDYLQSL